MRHPTPMPMPFGDAAHADAAGYRPDRTLPLRGRSLAGSSRGHYSVCQRSRGTMQHPMLCGWHRQPAPPCSPRYLLVLPTSSASAAGPSRNVSRWPDDSWCTRRSKSPRFAIPHSSSLCPRSGWAGMRAPPARSLRACACEGVGVGVCICILVDACGRPCVCVSVRSCVRSSVRAWKRASVTSRMRIGTAGRSPPTHSAPTLLPQTAPAADWFPPAGAAAHPEAVASHHRALPSPLRASGRACIR